MDLTPSLSVADFYEDMMNRLSNGVVIDNLLAKMEFEPVTFGVYTSQSTYAVAMKMEILRKALHESRDHFKTTQCKFILSRPEIDDDERVRFYDTT